jgi:dTDP-glucose 4,6-dehydratase
VRVVVTGGAGFLGSFLCESLVSRGDPVLCLDNLSTGRLPNISHLLDFSNFEFMEADVSDEIRVKGNVDVVAHFASPASPQAYLSRPLETLAVGSRGTENALQLAARHKARFILASTSEVYGSSAVHPQPEDYWGNVNPIGPRSAYNEAKRFAEALTMAYRKAKAVDTGIIRIFNTYGPRMAADDGRVVTTFITQALNGDSLTVYGTGSQTRSLCYVDDLVWGILAMIDSAEPGPINLGNPKEISVAGIARLILAITRSQSSIVYRPLPQDDPSRRCPQITLAEELLGWCPKISVEEGVRRTVAWFQGRPDEFMR